MMTLAELRDADAGIRFGSQFGGERLPTLSEVFSLVSGRCGLNIELKGAGAEAPVCGLINFHEAVAPTIVSSFDWAMLERVREIDQRIRIGLLASRRSDELLAAAIATGADAIHPRTDMVTTNLCASAHAHGLKVYTWTCDDPAEMRKLIADGVDGIMTNYPDRLVRVMAA